MSLISKLFRTTPPAEGASRFAAWQIEHERLHTEAAHAGQAFEPFERRIVAAKGRVNRAEHTAKHWGRPSSETGRAYPATLLAEARAELEAAEGALAEAEAQAEPHRRALDDAEAALAEHEKNMPSVESDDVAGQVAMIGALEAEIERARAKLAEIESKPTSPCTLAEARRAYAAAAAGHALGDCDDAELRAAAGELERAEADHRLNDPDAVLCGLRDRVQEIEQLLTENRSTLRQMRDAAEIAAYNLAAEKLRKALESKPVRAALSDMAVACRARGHRPPCLTVDGMDMRIGPEQ